MVKPVTAELAGEGVEILMGERKQVLGQLEGRAQAAGPAFAFGQATLQNEKRVEWLVRGRGRVVVTVRSDRGGTVTREIPLEATGAAE